MHFLPDVYVTCDVCKGERYGRETLEVRFKGLNIAEVLDLTVEQARELFSAHPKIYRVLDTLIAVGLGYIRLGQAATTLSGGEAQRIKLSRELARRATGSTLYILDEPTTGLHFDDTKKLLSVLHTLADRGNTVVVIEHHLDVIKTADHVIDLGREGGDGGGRTSRRAGWAARRNLGQERRPKPRGQGRRLCRPTARAGRDLARIVATGTPEQVAAVEASYTGAHLAPLLGVPRAKAS